MLKRLLFVLFCLVLTGPSAAGNAASLSAPRPATHPLVDREANRVRECLPIAEETVNILLLGIDARADEKDYTYRVEESHTDTMILLAINPAAGRLDLISLPRDTMAYVPGTRGVYKLNCAINVGATRAGKPAKSPEGFAAVRDTVSWLLGGLRIDHFVAVDMDAMAAVGDIIGGVEFDVDMTYSGHNGRRYSAGMQHLDGTGILDYIRARTRATVDPGSDLARTGRQRAMLSAIFSKLMANKLLIVRLMQGMEDVPAIRDGLFTDLGIGGMLSLLNAVQASQSSAATGDAQGTLRSHVIKGTYRNAFGNWKFTFTDQAHRRAVLKEVFGVEVPALEYVSYEHAKWLYEYGFSAIRALTAADGIQGFAGTKPSERVAAAGERLDALCLDVQEAFLRAANTHQTDDTRALSLAVGKLREAGDALAALVAYPAKGENVSWRLAKYHDDDRLVNEVYVNFR